MKEFKHRTVFKSVQETKVIMNWLSDTLGPRREKWNVVHIPGSIAAVEFASSRDKFLFDLRWAGEITIIPVPETGEKLGLMKILHTLGEIANVR